MRKTDLALFFLVSVLMLGAVSIGYCQSAEIFSQKPKVRHNILLG